MRRGFLFWSLATLLVAPWLALAGCASPAPSVPRFAFGPYLDLANALPAAGAADAAFWDRRFSGAARALAEMPGRQGRALTLAFSTGECGAERIAGGDAATLAPAIVAALERSGLDFIVSSGGEAGSFTCSSDAGMEAFLAHFASPRLVGVDFDIEGRFADEQIDALMTRVAAAQRRHRELRISFTLATLAASDGSGAGLNDLGRRVLRSAVGHDVRGFLVNLMVMDYGAPAAANCVLAADACDMGRSAIQAAANLQERRGIDANRIELTPMIGFNDSAGNVLGLEDAARIARHVRAAGLAGLHFWSADRDAACARGQVRADCSGLPDVPAGAFLRAFAQPLP